MLNTYLQNLNDWSDILKEEVEKEYFIQMSQYLTTEYNCSSIYPSAEDIFNSLKFTSFQNTKVVILGQDPYHGHGQAHGLSFSVNPKIKTPPSLLNIYKELNADLGLDIPNNGYLVDWAEQGVLLLNTTLTVQKANPNSHQKIGWSIFTDKIIQELNNKKEPIVFILWGKNAISKKSLITNTNHLILTSTHPSPLSANKASTEAPAFFGSKQFSKANKFLKEHNSEEINWQINNI